ncbi:MAG: purine-nucleoside phosphorylase [Lentisphaeria bacterium]|nr:purine-nucleoside phosphorylase [Lentisphaeria bacterium]
MNQSLKDQAAKAAEEFVRHFSAWRAPAYFVQTGSGLHTDGLLDSVLGELPLDALPGMPRGQSPAGHGLRLVLGLCGENQVLVAEGRRHLYEGYGATACVLPVCAAALAGVKNAVLAGAAGSVNPDFRPGTLIALTDFINNLGTSPLTGPEPLGESYFLPMNEAYSQRLISAFINCAPKNELYVRLGVYQANIGPQYETPAEVNAARANGADLVGMSTVLETIAARALGMEVLGLSVVTNFAAANSLKAPSHREVKTVANQASPALMRALNTFLSTSV